MNLTGQGVYQKGRKRTKGNKPTDRPFLDWLKNQPSALTGETPCDPCHYRTAANSGIGCKPLYSAIPLTREEHMRQHQVGQYNFMPRQWWEAEVEKHLQLWQKSINLPHNNGGLP